MKENFYAQRKERLEGEMRTEAFSVIDRNGAERFSASLTKHVLSDAALLEDFQLQKDGSSFDVLERMGIEKGEVEVRFVRDGEYAAGTQLVKVPYPDSPYHVLIFVHELSHIAQSAEFQIPTEKISSPTYESVNALHLLRSCGIELTESDLFEKVERIDARFARSSLLPMDDPERSAELKEITREWMQLNEAYPVLSLVRKLRTPLVEQDAHRRTNELLADMERELGVEFDDCLDSDPTAVNRDDNTQDAFMRAYAVLGTRKMGGMFGSGLPVLQMCKELGIEVNAGELNEDLQSHIDTPEFQAALTAVRMKVKGFGI